MNLVAALIVLVACWPTGLSLHERWTAWEETTYTHGWLIAAVCLFLLWRNRRAAPPAEVRVRIAPLTLLLGTGLVWAFALRAGLVSVEWLLLPLMMWLAIWAATGMASAGKNLFAVGYLYFAMPLWGAVNGIFLWSTVMVVRSLLRVIGIPAYFNGNFVQVPAGTFEIAGGCSGLHFVIVGLALGALMGEMRGDDWRGRLKLLVVAGVLAVVTNWVRVFTIILAGHYSNMQHYLVTTSHYGYGWILFAVAMAAFFLFERRMPLPASGTEAPAVQGPWSAQLPAALRLGLVMGLVALLHTLSGRSAPAPASAQVAAPADSSPGQWQPVVQGADLQTVETAETTEGRIERRSYIFLSQRQGKELGGYQEDPLGGLAADISRTTHIAGVPATVYEATGKQGDRWLVAATYQAGDRGYAEPMPAKVRHAWESLLRLRSQPAALNLVLAPCSTDCQAAEQAIGAFVSGQVKEGT